MNKLVVILSVLALFTSCSVDPKPIDYGMDACHFCKMNIVDQQHAAEIVTKKAKVFKYDAIECMLKDSANNKVDNVGLYLVMDYKRPNEWLDATTATYLISERVPSPMGEFLSAFKTPEEANAMKLEHSGETYNWNEIINEIK
jgi:copper chaperone NosL